MLAGCGAATGMYSKWMGLAALSSSDSLVELYQYGASQRAFSMGSGFQPRRFSLRLYACQPEAGFALVPSFSTDGVAVHSVLCSLFNALSSMFNALCSMFYVLCSMFYVLCSLFSVQCSMFSV